MRLKFKIPFTSKKISTVPTDEAMVEATEIVKSYPLLHSNDHIQALLKQNFLTEKGVQLHPAKFLNEIIADIERGELNTKEEFAIYMHHKMTSIVVPSLPAKKGMLQKQR
ncbi:MAG TPA: hypothetical protein VGE31_00600 [Candidatus Paceibacterota bacterium]